MFSKSGLLFHLVGTFFYDSTRLQTEISESSRISLLWTGTNWWNLLASDSIQYRKYADYFWVSIYSEYNRKRRTPSITAINSSLGSQMGVSSATWIFEATIHIVCESILPQHNERKRNSNVPYIRLERNPLEPSIIFGTLYGFIPIHSWPAYLVLYNFCCCCYSLQRPSDQT